MHDCSKGDPVFSILQHNRCFAIILIHTQTYATLWARGEGMLRGLQSGCPPSGHYIMEFPDGRDSFTPVCIRHSPYESSSQLPEMLRDLRKYRRESYEPGERILMGIGISII